VGDVPDDLYLQITDEIGREIFEQQVGFISGQYTISTSSLSTGLYYVNLYNGGSKIYGGKLNVIRQ